jgi:hypothetical protein
LAERRYDPSNRLVASTLEKRWNDAMQRLLELEAELADFERHAVRSITAEQKQQILQLGSPSVGQNLAAEVTYHADLAQMHHAILRSVWLLKKVTAALTTSRKHLVTPFHDCITIVILWQTDFEEVHRLSCDTVHICVFRDDGAHRMFGRSIVEHWPLGIHRRDRAMWPHELSRR